uniref:Uncharacterized protein n=1 Tax=Glossina palpalis gambiensis TaxID=67801 RepID=A0A1B0AXS8_9MUSC
MLIDLIGHGFVAIQHHSWEYFSARSTCAFEFNQRHGVLALNNPYLAVSESFTVCFILLCITMHSTGNDDLIDVTKSSEDLKSLLLLAPAQSEKHENCFGMQQYCGQCYVVGFFLRYCLAFIFDMNSSLIHFMPFYQMIVGYDSSQLITDGHNLIVIIIIINNITLSSCSCIHTFCISSRRILQYIRLLKLFFCLRLSVRQLHHAFVTFFHFSQEKNMCL